ncbi:MAG: KOW domain-containing RNA-binding protein [Oscillospiraceae bacterium]|nr:KOW domain-containing RNA-binding protein [Oscillospiraceae bacterium]MBQ8377515.1 KOW domain-containing RNA-binding protein [Oscillospiraceae bacterium]MBQ8884161.1 KOW domain-containing RNA-binding protein [Oscillospiraceae bacterium]
MVNIQIGSIVRARAGREKDRLMIVAQLHDGFVELCDGKERKLEKPKRKNIKHISPTHEVISMEMLTNKKLRKILSEFETRNSEKP